MYQNPYQSFDAFLDVIRDADPKTLPNIDESIDYLAPFMINPDKHSEHVKKLLRAFLVGEFLRSAQMMEKKTFFGRVLSRQISLISDKLKEQYRVFVEEAERLGPILRDTVQPAELVVDILPVRAIETDPSYSAIGLGAVCTELKVGIRPTEGFNVQRISLDLDFGRSKGVQILYASPETEYEVIGEREIQSGVTDKTAISSTGKGEAKVGAKAFGYEARVNFVDSETQQTEYVQSASRTLRDRPTIPKVSCTDVGANVHWDLYQTPTQEPTGGLRFLCNLLVPRTERIISVEVILTACLSLWGTVSTRCQKEVTLVFKE